MQQLTAPYDMMLLSRPWHKLDPRHLPHQFSLNKFFNNNERDHVLKHLKVIHALLGLLSLLLFVILSTAPADSLPLALPLSKNPLINTALLSTAVGNLLLGCYLNAQTRARRRVQQTASVLILLSLVASVGALPYPQIRLSGLPLAQIAQFLLVLGAILHLTINLNSLNPYHKVTVSAGGLRETGTVKWFNITKGFGFITRDQGDDVFVHYRAIRGEGHRALTEGQRVDFVVVKNHKGLQAEDVITTARNP